MKTHNVIAAAVGIGGPIVLGGMAAESQIFHPVSYGAANFDSDNTSPENHTTASNENVVTVNEGSVSKVPFTSQLDKRWKTPWIAPVGCLVTSISAVLNSAGTSITPDQVASGNYFDGNHGLYKTAVIAGYGMDIFNDGRRANKLLAQGIPVIAQVSSPQIPSHFIVLKKISGDHFEIMNPAATSSRDGNTIFGGKNNSLVLNGKRYYGFKFTGDYRIMTKLSKIVQVDNKISKGECTSESDICVIDPANGKLVHLKYKEQNKPVTTYKSFDDFNRNYDYRKNTLSVDRIRSILKYFHSPYVNDAATIAVVADYYGIDRAVILAGWTKESSDGADRSYTFDSWNNPGNMKIPNINGRSVRVPWGPLRQKRGEYSSFSNRSLGMADVCLLIWENTHMQKINGKWVATNPLSIYELYSHYADDSRYGDNQNWRPGHNGYMGLKQWIWDFNSNPRYNSKR